MKSIGQKISSFLESPLKVIFNCVILLIVGLVFDGSIWRIFHAHENRELLISKISEENQKIRELNKQLTQIKNIAYIEKQARDRLEFLEKDDLLFVFSEE